MVVGDVPESVDFLVAGAGPGGYVAAIRAAQAGRRVLLVDPEGAQGVGGVCLHTGCIPSKTLIEAAELRHRVASQSLGLGAGQLSFDAPEFQKQKNQIVESLASAVRTLLKNAKVEIVQGKLSLTERDSALINTHDDNLLHYQFKSLILATGSSTIALDNLPFDGNTILSSSDVLAMTSLPASIGIIGAGYIGVELGVALAKLGVAVTMVEQAGCVLPSMSGSVCEVVQKRLVALGVSFCLSSRALAFESGELSVESNTGIRQSLALEKIVVAVGRRPNITELGLELLGVSVDPDSRLTVSADRRLLGNIHAIGDITPGPALAHKAMAEAEVAVDALCGKKTAFDAAIPEIVFGDPEIGTVGMTPESAELEGIDAGLARFPIAASGRAATQGAREGFTQIVFDRSDGTVIGTQMVGPHASERIAEAVLAIELGATVEDLALIVHPHPTLSETSGEAARIAVGRPLHSLNKR